MRPVRVAATLLLAAAALACADWVERARLLLPPVLDAPRAWVRVDVAHGLSRSADLPEPGEVPVAIVLDASLSMATPISPRASRYAAARQLATRYLAALPRSAPVSLRVPGLTSGAECGPAVPIEPATEGPATEGLAALIPRLPPPRGESSLAAALEDVARDLVSRGAAAGARVVVLSDLEPACASDPCQAASRLVAAGAEIEVVALGEAEPPACLAGLTSRGLPSFVSAVPVPAAPRFRVERAPGGSDAEASERLAEGVAGDRRVFVGTGRVVVTVELDPPVAVGPLDLEEGDEAWVRVLDFPELDPPVREVWVEGAGRSDDVVERQEGA